MGGKNLLNAHPKNFLGSKGARRCRVCGKFHLICSSTLFIFSLSNNLANPSAIIRKYHLDICRQCFRERALDIGFVKVSFFQYMLFILLNFFFIL
jgi:small subunit ribosomal protein S29e